jgi:hypothetical protein
LDGHALEVKSGQPVLDEEDDEDDERKLIDNPVSSNYGLLNQTDENIRNIYNVQYLTIVNDVKIKDVHKKVFPEEIASLFHEHVTGTMEASYWIKVDFPAHITTQNIHDMTVHINTFPIANKSFYSFVHIAKTGMKGIIPLNTLEGEHFISIEKVTDAHGVVYEPLPYSTGQQTKANMYSIKRGGIERFDRRSAGEYFERTIDLLRSEIAAFSSLNADNMRNIISEIQENLKQIETKYDVSDMRELTIPSYLLLNLPHEDSSIFVEYWATLCEWANGLKTGKILTPLTSVMLEKNSCRLLNTTKGGKSEADVAGRQDAFRYVLTTRDQILTHEDAANFCRYELGEKIKQVKVLRGVAVSSKPKEGLIRTIDIHLTPSSGYEHIVEEMQPDLLAILHRKSPDAFRYRIIIDTRNNSNTLYS